MVADERSATVPQTSAPSGLRALEDDQVVGQAAGAHPVGQGQLHPEFRMTSPRSTRRRPAAGRCRPTPVPTVAITAMATAVTTMAPVTNRAEPTLARSRGMTIAPATAPVPTIPSSNP